MKTIDYVKWAAKALGGAAVAGVGALAVGYADDSLTKAELWFAISTAVAAGGAVFGISNGPKPVAPADEFDDEQYYGSGGDVE